MLKVPTSTKVVVQASRYYILKQTPDGGCPHSLRRSTQGEAGPFEPLSATWKEVIAQLAGEDARVSIA